MSSIRGPAGVIVFGRSGTFIIGFEAGAGVGVGVGASPVPASPVAVSPGAASPVEAPPARAAGVICAGVIGLSAGALGAAVSACAGGWLLSPAGIVGVRGAAGLDGAAEAAAAGGVSGLAGAMPFESPLLSPAGSLPARAASPPAVPASSAVSAFTALARARFFGALTSSRSTFSVVSMAVAVPPSPSSELNHSRIVASKPADTVDMWFLMTDSGMPSWWHFSTTALDLTPRSLATSKTRLAN